MDWSLNQWMDQWVDHKTDLNFNIWITIWTKTLTNDQINGQIEAWTEAEGYFFPITVSDWWTLRGTNISTNAIEPVAASKVTPIMIIIIIINRR